ncbi:guanylate kinase, putative [Trypanosoma equiperdum]|nr:guanylate kinase, putative [Trypanosoma equiperdum]
MSSGSTKLEAIVVCGPSGAGKTTLLERLMGAYPNRFGFSVSHTTRAPREGEVHGREYFFSTRESMLTMEKEGKFIELCDVHGNLYGTSIDAVKEVQSTGKVCVIDMDVKGAQKLRASGYLKNVLYLFVTVPSIDVLRARIQKRGALSEEVLQRRIATAEVELHFLGENPTFFSHVITNEELEVSYKKLCEIVGSEFLKYGMEGLNK